MNISSRTPEGIPNRCPVCGKAVVIEPSNPPGDAPCSHCGHLLWFTDTQGNETVVTKWPEGRTVVGIDSRDWELEGLLDIGEQVLREDLRPDLVLDLSRVTFFPSVTMSKLVTLAKKLAKRDGTLTLSNVGPELCEIFAITRLDRLFEFSEA